MCVDSNLCRLLSELPLHGYHLHALVGEELELIDGEGDNLTMEREEEEGDSGEGDGDCDVGGRHLTPTS